MSFLEAWRPHVDEIVLALDEEGPFEETARAVGDLVDDLTVLPALPKEGSAEGRVGAWGTGRPGMEAYLGWMHSACAGAWVLRADDDELPSRALIESLPTLTRETEPTHYWLPRTWIYPTADQAIAEGLWARDIQLRLVRNVPGIWRFSGAVHSNIRVLGAGRIADAPLLHLVLLLSDVAARRAKADAYEAALLGLSDDVGFPINDVFVPEDVGVTDLAHLGDADALTVTRYLDEAGPQAREGRRLPVRRVEAGEVLRWNENRMVPDGAYAAEVKLVHAVRPFAAATVQHVQVEVTNFGDTWWPRGPEPRPEIVLGHRWQSADGQDVGPATVRTPFSETVAPGATTRLTVPIQAPPVTGELTLLVDVVHEWVRWFEHPATQTVTVTSPYDDRFYAATQAGAEKSARAVLPQLLRLVPARSLIDVGCGRGTWLRVARELGVGDVVGVDGDWVSSAQLEVPAETFRQVDLTRPLELDREYDLALALEVAEHLPVEAAPTFVASLAAAAPIVAFSAAVPGQGGYSHVNEQWPSYWMRLFEQHGYEPVDALRAFLWDDEDVDWWYAQNLLLYGRTDALAAHPSLADHPQRGRAPLSLVHPRRMAGG